MRSVIVAFVLLAFVTAAPGQEPAAVMPSWLVPYAGSEAEINTASPTLIEVSYATTAKPDEVVAHYRKLFEAATLPFVPNSDGVGASIRAAAPECDLLVKIRAQDAGTLTRISCAAKTGAAQGSPVVVEVAGDNRSAVEKAREAKARRMSERIEQGKEHTQRVLAETEEKRRRGIENMAVYDQPVDSREKKRDAAAPAPAK